MSATHEPKQFKSILNKHKLIDHWFWGRYGINPYSGCEHACTYCDSRSHKYHLHEDFDQTVYVKTNAPQMLDDRIRRARTLLPDVVVMSGAGDPYQPAEAVHSNTRQCLEVLHKHRYPVHILTKSALVEQDADLLADIGKTNWCSVSVTITTPNADVARFLEPGAHSPARRFAIVSRIKQRGNIQTGVLLIPVVPLLGDDAQTLEDMVKCTLDSGGDYLLFGGGMTMRDKQAAWFLKTLGQSYPDLVEPVLALYDARIDADGQYAGSYGPDRRYAVRIARQLIELCDKHGLKFRLKRFIPDDWRRDNYVVAEDLLDRAYLMQSTGKAWTKLFWAGQNIQNLKESVREVEARGELEAIRNVLPPIADRVRAILANGED